MLSGDAHLQRNVDVTASERIEPQAYISSARSTREESLKRSQRQVQASSRVVARYEDELLHQGILAINIVHLKLRLPPDPRETNAIKGSRNRRTETWESILRQNG